MNLTPEQIRKLVESFVEHSCNIVKNLKYNVYFLSRNPRVNLIAETEGNDIYLSCDGIDIIENKECLHTLEHELKIAKEKREEAKRNEDIENAKAVLEKFFN